MSARFQALFPRELHLLLTLAVHAHVYTRPVMIEKRNINVTRRHSLEYRKDSTTLIHVVEAAA
jgi:hypothetical protein